MLIEIGATYIEQAQVGKYLCDFIIPASNLVIETDGDYWHSSEKRKQLDKVKDDYLRKIGFSVLRLPENKIKNSTEWCTEQIKLMSHLKQVH